MLQGGAPLRCIAWAVGRSAPRRLNQIVHLGALIHFLPSLGRFHENYVDPTLRSQDWSGTLCSLALSHPLIAPATAVIAVCCSGLAVGGVGQRMATILGGASWYVLASVNAFETQTLALSALWAMFWLFAILGQGSGNNNCEDERVHSALASFYFLGTMMSAGLHKLAQGWPSSGSVANLLNMPTGTFLRDWVVSWRGPSGFSRNMTTIAEWAALAAELVIPLAVVIPRTRSVGIACYTIFHVVAFSLLAVPPLFGMLYLGAIVVLVGLPQKLADLPLVQVLSQRSSHKV